MISSPSEASNNGRRWIRRLCCLFLGQLHHSVGTCPTQSSKYGSNEIHPYALVVVCSNGWTQCSNRVHWTSRCWPLISHHHNYTWIIIINQINEYFSPSFFTLTHTIPFPLISTYLLYFTSKGDHVFKKIDSLLTHSLVLRKTLKIISNTLE